MLAWALVAAIGGTTVWFVARGREQAAGEMAPPEPVDRLSRLDPVVLVRNGRVRGRLVDATTSAPIPGVRISLSRGGVAPELRWFRIENFYGVTGESPDFDFEAPCGSHWLVPEAPGYVAHPIMIDVTADAATNVGTLALQPGGALEGTVRAPSGATTTAEIYVRETGQAWVVRIGETDGAGRYRADTIPPGSYEVFAVETDPRWKHLGPSPRVTPPWPIGSAQVTAGVPAKLDARLPVPASLTMVLTGDFQPVPDGDLMSIWFAGCPLQLSATDLTITAVDGTPLNVCGTGFGTTGFTEVVHVKLMPSTRTTVSLSLPAARCKVVFSPDGFEPIERVVDLVAGHETRLDLAPTRVASEPRPR
jgi:hypothetical protein